MRSALLLAGIAALGLLAACSTPSATSPAAGSATAAATSSATPAAAAADGTATHPLAFGQTWGTDQQIKVTLGAPAPYTPSSSAFIPGGATARAVAFDVTIAIPTSIDKAFPAMLLTVKTTAGDRQAQSIEDVGNNVGTPTANVPPGKSLTWRVAYAVPAGPNEFTAQVSTAIGGQDVYFTGKI